MFKFKSMFHGIKCTEIEKTRITTNCCKLCSFKDLCRSDNDSRNQMKTGKINNGHALTTITTGVEKQSV